MTSVRRGRETSAAPTAAAPAAAPTLSPESAALSASIAGQRERVVQAALDAVRFPLTRLVRSVAERLTTHPTLVGLATLEVEVRDAVLAMGRDLLSEVVRLRGTGYRGHSYICPCGVRLEYKEIAPLEQRTWFGTITLERAVYAGAGCAVRAHHMPSTPSGRCWEPRESPRSPPQGPRTPCRTLTGGRWWRWRRGVVGARRA